jgi:hypothetical protein
MQRNPYEPPATAELEVHRDEGVSRRPFSVWLILLLLIAFALVIFLGTTRSLLLVMPNRSNGLSFVALIVAIGLRLALLVIVLFAMISIYRRGRWGRWLGLAVIVALALSSVLRPDDYSQYPNDAQRAGAQFARFFVMPSLLAWWAYAFAFSSRAKRYFLPLSPARGRGRA